MENLNIQPIYVPCSLPIFTADLSKHCELELNLAKEAINELKTTHPETTKSNVYAKYMSPWKSHLLNHKLTPICDKIVTIAHTVSHKSLSADLRQLNCKLVVSDCWGIIYEDSDYTRVHNHFPAEFGCSIYLETEKDCAPIIFSGEHAVQPQSGSMILFPGILNHEVPRNTGRRTVLALNIIKVLAS